MPDLVGRADELAQLVGPAVGALHGIREGRVVAPRAVARELEGWHQLDGTDAQLAQVAQPSSNTIEGARPAVHAGAEGAHVQLVDDEVVPGRRLEAVGAPIEGSRVLHHAVPDRVGQPAGARVDAPQLARGRGQQEAVLVAGPGCRDVRGPRAVGLGRQRCRPRIPAVEAAGNRHRGRVRRPDPERDTPVVRQRAKAGSRRRSCSSRGAHARIVARSAAQLTTDGCPATADRHCPGRVRPASIDAGAGRTRCRPAPLPVWTRASTRQGHLARGGTRRRCRGPRGR